MRPVVLHPGGTLPGSPDSRIQKFTRGPFCGLMRPHPLSFSLRFDQRFWIFHVSHIDIAFHDEWFVPFKWLRLAFFISVAVGVDYARSVSRSMMVHLAFHRLPSGYGDCLVDIESTSLLRIPRRDLSLHASHQHTDSQRIRNDRSDREYASNGIHH